jgi:hypothetical protein
MQASVLTPYGFPRVKQRIGVEGTTAQNEF